MNTVSISMTPEMERELRNLIKHGIEVKRTTKDLRESFNESLKDFCEKYNIDKKLVRKIVKTAYEIETKGDRTLLEKEKEVIDILESLV